MKKKAVYLGFRPPVSIMDELLILDKRPAVQTLKYGKSAIDFLATKFDVLNVSTPPIQDYPYCKKIFLLNLNYENAVGFINLLFFKQFFRFFLSIFHIAKLKIKHGKELKYIFLHGVHMPFLLTAVLYKMLGIKVAVMITDPPGVILDTDGRLRRFLKLIDSFFIKKSFLFFDYFIVPSEKFVTDFKLSDKNTLVMPGYFNVDHYYRRKTKSNFLEGQVVNVCYAGSIYRNNGLDVLVHAFKNANSNIKLHVIGDGEYLDDLKSISPNSVKFHGFRTGKELEDLMQKMHIFVNVRDPNLDFANYSFPSKLFEYLSFGKVVITSKITTIPEEITECFEFFDLLTSESIMLKINQVVNNYNECIKKSTAATEKLNSSYSSRGLKFRLVDFLGDN